MTDPKPSQTLLITIGSTLFPTLTDLALSPIFLDRLTQLGVKELIVQYGKADLTLPPGVKTQSTKNGDLTFNYPSDGSGINVKVLRYTDKFEELVKSCKWAISHAGSGSILTVLRTPRPLLVVPNSELMDNHQAQLADALGGGGDEGEEGYLLVSTVEDLIDNLPRLVSSDYRPKAFPPVDHSRFRSILDETMGYAL